MAESASEEHLGILPGLQVLGQEGAGLPQILGDVCKAQADGNDITLPSVSIWELVALPSRVQYVFNYKAVMTMDND